jgi:hypothetical protein
MIFYLASDVQLPRIDFIFESPAFNTKDIDDSKKDVKIHFSLKEILYVGSDEGCGCGFRHALI